MITKFVSVEVVLHTNDESLDWIAWFETKDNFVTKTAGTDANWYIYFAPLPEQTPDMTIRSLCKEIESLPENIKVFWKRAMRREFLVGYHAGNEWPAHIDILSPETLQNVTRLQAAISLAIYRAVQKVCNKKNAAF